MIQEITVLATDRKDIFRQLRIIKKPEQYIFKDVKLKHNEDSTYTAVFVFDDGRDIKDE